MKKMTLTLCLLLLGQPVWAETSTSDLNLDDDTQKISYVLGVVLAEGIAPQIDGLNLDAFFAGQNDIFRKKEIRVNREEREEIMQLIAERDARIRREMTTKANEEGQNFLAKNKERAGVTTTASGLQYEVLSAGSGKKPGPFNKVQVHYRGTLVDGTEFDSSYARNQPLDIGIDGVIQGWQEALLMMPEGSKWRVAIPPHLAYGERGAGDRIGPNATLLFDIELLKILDE